MKLSFCTTCFNRFPQLKQTLPENLEAGRRFQGKVEFVLINFVRYDPQPGDDALAIHRWVLKRFRKDLERKILRYFLCCDLTLWHASVAKNIAHDQGRGAMLINTDCDNFVSAAQIRFLLNQRKSTFLYHGWTGEYYDGTYGHIGMSRTLFNRLGGYDEHLLPHSGQDHDLLRRAKHFSGYPMQVFWDRKAIFNDKAEGLRFTHSPLRWREMKALNREKSDRNFLLGEHRRTRRVQARAIIECIL